MICLQNRSRMSRGSALHRSRFTRRTIVTRPHKVMRRAERGKLKVGQLVERMFTQHRHHGDASQPIWGKLKIGISNPSRYRRRGLESTLPVVVVEYGFALSARAGTTRTSCNADLRVKP
jgi:hypothetical protein